MFDLRGTRSNDVGVLSRIGHELFDDDGEEILALHSLDDSILVRKDSNGIRVVNNEHVDVWI